VQITELAGRPLALGPLLAHTWGRTNVSFMTQFKKLEHSKTISKNMGTESQHKSRLLSIRNSSVSLTFHDCGNLTISGCSPFLLLDFYTFYYR